MFGYIIPNYDELRVRELKEYRRYYCGLCKCLKERYGLKGQISLTYDMTFLGLLLSSLYEEDAVKGECRCVAHPTTRHEYITTKYLYYAADMNILLMYYKCMDDWNDDHNIVKAGYAALIKRAGKKAACKYPDKAGNIADGLRKLSDAEKNRNLNVDYVSGIFGEICAEIFACKKDEWYDCLRQLGFYIGKFIYLLDAYEDLEKDLSDGCYNPYLKMHHEQNFDDKVKNILLMMMSEAGKKFERLPILENVNVLRNIIYSGVWCRYEMLLKQKLSPKDK